MLLLLWIYKTQSSSINTVMGAAASLLKSGSVMMGGEVTGITPTLHLRGKSLKGEIPPG